MIAPFREKMAKLEELKPELESMVFEKFEDVHCVDLEKWT